MRQAERARADAEQARADADQARADATLSCSMMIRMCTGYCKTQGCMEMAALSMYENFQERVTEVKLQRHDAASCELLQDQMQY